MKFLLTFFVNFLCVIGLFGQGPVFDYSWFPLEGAQFVGQSASVIGVYSSETGPDHTWDYSGLLDSSNQKVTTYISPSDTENPLWYPNANLASHENGAFSFLNTSFSGVEYYGEFTNLFSVILTDPASNFQFPFSYGDNFTDSLQGSLNFSGISLIRTGEVSFEADGYGTLILPDGRTFDNVLRYRFTENTTDALDTQEVIFTSISESFVWISPVCPEPLLRISRFYQQNGFNEFESKSVFYSLGVFTSINEPTPEVSLLTVFPNPSNGLISVSFEEPGFSSTEISIFDMHGKIVFYSNQSQPISELDLRHLPKGIYILKANLENSFVTRRFTIF